ncbi:calmodulin-binding receptor-like cytoplasmic kinase 3 [Bidens hawaiensis]|uniref:calmodulin-binding receptor-like cytoplasmic kinase 3 n=1 Tax=Bidens hawaiensis TaxID=980011 RepID=UPI00404A6C7C
MLPVVAITDEEKLHSLATEHAFHRFSIIEMQLATRNFDDDLVIGKGGFGKVYKGHMYGTRDTTGRVVAIKRLDSYSMQGAAEFMTEIEMLTKLRHCNLVSLIGYCYDNKEMILVYEYMPNGTIEHHLHKAKTPLSWMHRLKISIGAARGLDYLHNGVGTQHGVIYRDVKSSNILLTKKFRAIVADFGFARLGDPEPDKTYVLTKVKGTVGLVLDTFNIGYLDPEYMRTYQLTPKSDVYSFGVLLIEILTGRRPVECRRPPDEKVTVRWAYKKYNEGEIMGLVDPQMKEAVDSEIIGKLFKLAFQCTAGTRADRPDMKVVGEQLWAIRMDYIRN